MEQLRVHVERIVRPVRAAVSRKNKMREELLAHLMEKTRALTDSGMDEAEARTKAVEELGDPAALRADMQATVPAFERVCCVRLPLHALDAFFEKEKDETSFHHAYTRTLPIAVLVLMFFGGLGAIRWAGPAFGRQPNTGTLAECAFVLTGAYLVTIAACFSCFYLADVTGLRNVLSKTTPYNGWIKGAVLCLYLCAELALIYGANLLFIQIFTPDSAAVVVGALRETFGREYLILGVLLLLVAFPLLSIVMKHEHEQWARWDRIELDE